MQVPRLLFGAVSREATGTITVVVDPDAVIPLKVRIEIERGFVYSIHGGPRTSRPEEDLRRMLDRCGAGSTASLDEGAAPMRLGRVRPFQPAQVVRNHVEAVLGAEAAAALRERVGEALVHLVYAPHPSCLGRDERPLVALLGAPRTLADLERSRIAPPIRIERLLAFLDAVGSLRIEGDLGDSAWSVLGLVEGAPLDEVRRAYKRLAREVHPDLHPGADAESHRALSDRFTRLTAAYRRLLPNGE